MYVSADPLLTSTTLFGTYDPTKESLLDRQIPYGAPFYNRGRVALWAVLGSMGIGRGDDVLLPAFICDSVLGPVEAVGASARFYPVPASLRIELRHIREAVTPATRAVLVPHYYGLPTELEAIRQFCESQGLWLIEDCAHALYSFQGEAPLGRAGHAAIFSPWKSLPLPDGGILALNDPRIVRPDPLPEHGVAGLAARMAYRALPTVETAIGWSPRLRLLGRSELRGSMQERDRSPSFPRETGSDFSYQLLQRSDGVSIRERRREHYSRLAKAVASQPYLQAIASDLGPGVCPLGFAVRTPDRERAREHFFQRGINVRAYWEQLPREVGAAEFPEAHLVSKEILILPVHQSLTQRQIDHVRRAIEELSGRVSE